MTRKMSALILAAAVTGAWALSQPAQAQVTEARGESTTEDGARGDEASVPREERIAREWRSLPKGERIAREQRRSEARERLGMTWREWQQELPRKERVAREWRSLPQGERVAREKNGLRPEILDD